MRCTACAPTSKCQGKIKTEYDIELLYSVLNIANNDKDSIKKLF